MKTFEKWETEDIKLTFGIEENENLNLLSEWLAAKEPISDKEKMEVSFLQSRLHKFVDYWNEADLKAFLVL